MFCSAGITVTGRSARGRGLAVSLVLALCIFASGGAEPPAAGKGDKELKETVGRLVKELDAEQFLTRERAQKSLIELGPRVIPYLPDAQSAASAEQRRRLVQVVQALGEKRATETAQATRVTLVNERIKLADALKAVQEQTGNEVADLREDVDQAEESPAVSLKLKGAAFWEAMDEICRKAGLEYDFYIGGGKLGLRPGGVASGPVSYSGPLRLVPRAVLLKQSLQKAARPASQANSEEPSRTCTVLVEMAWEPRLRPLLVEQSPSAVSGEDDRGQPITGAERGGKLELSLNSGGVSTEFAVALEPPDRTAREIRKLKGRLALWMPAAIETFKFDPLPPRGPVVQTRAGMTATLQQFRVNGELWEAAIRLEYSGRGPALESYQAWMLNNEIYLERKDGARFALNAGLNTTEQDAGRVGFQYRFTDVPGEMKEYTLVYRAPGRIVQVPVEYEFTHLPLP